jgi:hypothetical protein
MINAFKQIRLSNINISGKDGRIEVGNSGSLVFTSELLNLESNLNSKIDATSGVLDSAISGVYSTLDQKIDAQISGIIDMAPDALNTLNELAQALGDDENFATTLTNNLSNINNNISTLSGNLISTGSGLDVRVSDIENNYLDKRVGGSINGDVSISGQLAIGSSATTSLFVENGAVGINTETPTEALEVSGNGKFSGTVEVATPILSGHASTKGYVDSLFSKQQAFLVNVPVGTEEMSISFASNFSSTPVVSTSFESEVLYLHAIKNKTVSGFNVIFSDEIQEAGAVLNVFASNQ